LLISPLPLPIAAFFTLFTPPLLVSPLLVAAAASYAYFRHIIAMPELIRHTLPFFAIFISPSAAPLCHYALDAIADGFR